MLSSRFLAVSFLCIFYTSGLVVADNHHQLRGGNQFCQSVHTVTVTRTVAPGQPSPSSRPANNANPPSPTLTTRPGNVNLGNGGSVVKSTSTSSVTKNTKSGSAVRNTQTPSVKPDTNIKNGNTNTKNNSVNTKASSVVTSSTALPPAGTGNPDTGLTLDPSVIQKINGAGQAAGEANSLVSSNNFINFCVGKTITNGEQVQTGSCNPTPMGDIPSTNNMPSAKFTSPKNFDTLPANTAFTVSLQVNNLVTGEFTNAANTYFAAPQQLVNGVIQGHSHITVQKMSSLDSTEPLDARVFAFFKGLNGVANNGVLSADLTNGLPAGVYRISSINSAGNHQEVLGPVAQRGSFNDVIYVTVTDGGNVSSAVSSSAVPPSSSGISSSEPPVSTGAGGKKGSKGTVVSSSELPVSTSTGGKNGGKGGNVVSTSPALPESTTPATGNGKTDIKSPVVSSSASLPDSTPTQGADGKGGKGS